MSGGFLHAPYDPDPPKAEVTYRDLEQPWVNERLEAEARIRREADENPTAGAVGASAVLLMVNGRLEEALKRLEEASLQDPGNVALLNDLAVGWMERSRRSQAPRELIRAASAIERANALLDAGATSDEVTRSEVSFNRALLLEKLFLLRQAREEWARLCHVEGPSPWCEEARLRSALIVSSLDAGPWRSYRDRIESAVVVGAPERLFDTISAEPQLARELAETLLYEWGANGPSPSRGLPPLKVAREIGIALVRHNGDRMTEDSVLVIEQALRVGSERDRERLARAHRDYGQALEQLARTEAEQAIQRLQRAKTIFASLDSPMRFWCDYQTARGWHYLSEFSESRRKLEDLLQNDLTPYPSLLGKVYWLLGLNHLVRGFPAQSITQYEKSRALYESLGENANRAEVLNLIANNYRSLNDFDKVWKMSLEAQAFRPFHHKASRQYVIAFDAAIAALRDGFPEVSLNFQNEVARLAEVTGDPVRIGQALWWRGRIQAELGSLDAADEDLTRSLELIERMPPGLRERARADSWMMLGEIRALANPQESLELISEALDFYREKGFQVHTVRLFAARAKARLALGRSEGVESDLRSALAVLESQTTQLRNDPLAGRDPLMLLDLMRTVFDQMVRFQYHHQKDHEATLAYAEKSRGRGLLGDQSGTEFDPQQIRRQLPEGTALLYYHLLEDSLLIGLLTPDRLFLNKEATSEAELRRLIRQVLLNIRIRSDNQQPFSELFKRLLGPVWKALEDVERLVVLPDKILYSVPFAALLDPASGERVVESKAISVAPSGSVWLRAVRADRRLVEQGGDSLTLLVASSSSDLPGVAREIQAISSDRPPESVRLLSGPAIHKRDVLSSLATAVVFHFAGHAQGNPSFPEYSKLILSDSPSDENALFSKDLYGQEWPHLRLAVLAGCETASGPIKSGVGTLSLARPFLANGVPTVAASLWRLRDSTAAVFLARFHFFLGQGAPPVQALRKVQLEFLKGDRLFLRHPADWSGVQIIGAGVLPIYRP